MTDYQIKKTLESFTILYDTREKNTPALQHRIQQFGCSVEKKKLDFGDYSAKCTLPDGNELSLEKIVSIERKEHFDELAMCYTSQRERFTREFERAKQSNAKIYLLVEKASWEKAYAGIYRSQMSSQSLIASMTTWLARYNCSLLFCQPETSGKLIRDVLIKEMRERLIEYDTETIQMPKKSNSTSSIHKNQSRPN